MRRASRFLLCMILTKRKRTAPFDAALSGFTLLSRGRKEAEAENFHP
jgi:hypothetical protein